MRKKAQRSKKVAVAAFASAALGTLVASAVAAPVSVSLALWCLYYNHR